jgi:hypothetical protein
VSDALFLREMTTTKKANIVVIVLQTRHIIIITITKWSDGRTIITYKHILVNQPDSGVKATQQVLACLLKQAFRSCGGPAGEAVNNKKKQASKKQEENLQKSNASCGKMVVSGEAPLS